MARCTHKGCSQEYDPENNGPESCTYHPGAPIFHEGLKSWSCCSDVNKPVLDFDEFMQIPVSCVKDCKMGAGIEDETSAGLQHWTTHR